MKYEILLIVGFTLLLFGIVYLAGGSSVPTVDCKHLSYTKNQTLNKILMKQCIGNQGEGD